MHDIDAKINQISGQNDYMEQLAKVTGNINTIDMEMYKAVISKCSKCDFNLKILSKRFIENKDLDNTSKQLFEDFLKYQEEYDISNKTFAMKIRKTSKKTKKPKPPREIVDIKHTPVEVFKSDWFTKVREIEKLTRKYLKLLFGKIDNMEELTQDNFTELWKSRDDLNDISYFAGIHVTEGDSKIFMNIVNSYKCSRIIINEFLNPMYDVRKTIEKNEHIIMRAFKSKPMQQLSGEGVVTSVEDVINILEKFIIAKYRATISGNNKYYVKLFTQLIDPESSAEMEGTKFLDIMEQLNFEELGKNNRAYKFAVGARDVINKIVKNEELDSDEIIKQVQEIFDGEEEQEKPQEAEEAKEFNDLL